jgi:hypothetical protein
VCGVSWSPSGCHCNGGGRCDLDPDSARSCLLSRPSSNGANGPGRYESLFSAPSRASLNIRPIALSGLDIVSPVFCNKRFASSEMEGVEMASSLADSSPAWGDVKSLMFCTLASAKGVEGECGSEGGKFCIAFSTFLRGNGKVGFGEEIMAHLSNSS